MSNTMMTQTTDIHESLRHLFENVDGIDVGHGDATPRPLPEGDPLRVDLTEVRVVSRAEAGESAMQPFYVVRVYDIATGEQINRGRSLGLPWWQEEFHGHDFARFGWEHPNTYLVNGRHLFVSGGSWGVSYVTDDEIHFRFTPPLEQETANRAELRDRWLTANAEAVAAVQPAWADPELSWVEIGWGPEAEPDSMEFSRKVGAVVIEQAADIDDGVLTLVGSPQIRVTEQDYAMFEDVAVAARIGLDMIAAAAALGTDLTVSDVRNAATAAGVRPGDLIDQMEAAIAGADEPLSAELRAFEVTRG